MKYVVLLILTLVAVSIGAQPPQRQGGERRAFTPRSGNYMQRSFAPQGGSPYSRQIFPSGQPVMPSRSKMSYPQPGGAPSSGAPPTSYPSQYGKSYSPKQPSGAVDMPYSRNRIMRKAEETRSSGSSKSSGEASSSKSSRSRLESTKTSKPETVVNSRLVPGYDRPAMEPSQMGETLRDSTGQIREAIHGDGDVKPAVEDVRSRVTEMKGRLRNEPVHVQLKLSSIERMYKEGAAQIEEGERTGEQSKMQMGLEKIEKANEYLKEIE